MERAGISAESNYSCGARIIAKQPSQTVPAINTIAGDAFVNRLGKEQDVSLALMIPLAGEVYNVLSQRASERVLTEQNQLREAFLLHRAHPSFRECVCMSLQMR